MVLALVGLALTKVAVVYVPIFYRDSVDALDMDQTSAAIALPVGLILAYGGVRVDAEGHSPNMKTGVEVRTELRDRTLELTA